MSGTLVTGGAGSLGREIVRQIWTRNPTERIVIYSRDEGKQAAMEQEIPEGGPVGPRYMLGDIGDTDRLVRAMQSCDRVVHAAAQKMIDSCEYDTWAAIQTNVDGTVSVAKACLRAGVSRAVFVSSDKAPHSCSTYGHTKALGEDAWIHGNLLGDCKFFCVRYGNVIGSAKSVFHAWHRLAEQGTPLPVSHPDATRFYWTVAEAAQFCRDRLADGKRGCVYVPRMNSYRMMDIARTYSSNITISGWRCPEKLHEQLWTDHETTYTRSLGDYYCIYPETHPWCVDLEMPGTVVDRPLTSSDNPSSEWTMT